MAVITSNSITFIDNTGLEKYLYIRYSNDGVTFTENNGLTPGEWLGTCTTSSAVAPTDFGAYTWSKIRGEDGQDGIPGTNGIDGKTTYFHVKYSSVENPSVGQMTETPSKYIGTYVDYIEEDSEDPNDYKWVKFTGDDGIPGTNGIDGKTHYLHIKYSNDGGQTFTDNDGEDSGEYLGVYTDEIEEDSTDVTKYTWSLIKGKDAITYYTWIKYADDANGTNMSDDPTNKAYIGIAYNKESSQESEAASDYIWSLIKGSNGIDGDDGVTYYTWIKYADDDNGAGMSDDPTGKEYIGISYNNLDSHESDNPNDYTWSLFKGKDGIDGKTGVAGKGIKKINEYYLKSEYNTGITRDYPDWSLDIPTLNSIERYLWNYEETIFVIEEYDASGSIIKREEIDQSEPIIIGVYGETGSSLQIKYLSSKNTPTIINNDVSEWSDTIPTPIDGEKIYMIQKLSDETDWSIPIQISAEDGTTPNVTIINGYWYINGESTGIKAEGSDGEDGHAPSVTIGENGNWFIDGVDSGTKAQGEAGKDGINGKDGSSIEYVYYRSKNEEELNPPSYTNGNLTLGWTDSPQGITETYKYEYVSVRNKPSGGSWSAFSQPVIWSKWGEKGQDGDGVEYKYYLSNSNTVPTYSASDNHWTDDPTGVSIDNQYEYVVQIKISTGGQSISTPSLWAKYGEDGIDGKDGKGIDHITNYYSVTSDLAPAPTKWDDTPPAMTSTNRYLWNYEEIVYTNGDAKTTDPAIIGIRGDNGKDGTDGTDAVDFQIYSVDGFEFNDTLTSIELKTAAFQSGTVIEPSTATYKWKWWNSFSNLEDKYEDIPNATSSTITVNITDSYAFTGLKCEMTYDGKVYEDYISLTQKTIIYTSVVKFFEGSNIFTSSDLYIVAYIELYKNNERIESALDYANTYCTGVSTVSSTGVITSDITGSFSNDDTMYFICQNGNVYDVVLGQYTSGSWNKVNYDCKFTYSNTLYPNIQSNIIAISKESINKSQNIDFIVYDSNTEISRTNVNIIDSNDPIISNQAPENPSHNQLWLDTSVTPNILKIYNQSENQWIECTNYVGNTIYTSQPSSYSEGDLWILADGETCGDFGPGSMLKATNTSSSFNSSHWVDADQSLTNLKDNINQYFAFDAENGLKIGQKDENFYVKISSTEMGFYDNSNEQHKKVVYISNETANIDGLTVEKNLDVDCPATFNDEVHFFGFVWKKESNGSLSLAVGN